MAFTFTVEDGTGLSTATSYISITESNDLMEVNIHAFAAWAAIQDTTKERVLAWASQYLDEHVRWNGTKTVDDSALRWPRTNVCTIDGIEIDANTLPNQLKIATAKVASVLAADDITANVTSTGELTRIKADVVELEFAEMDPSQNANTAEDNLRHDLNTWIRGIGTVSGVRPAFARIIK